MYDIDFRLFKANLGLSPGRCLAQLQMQVAMERLNDPRQTNAGVAATLGFKDEFYFSRRFKQVVGPSPSAYRRRQGWVNHG